MTTISIEELICPSKLRLTGAGKSSDLCGEERVAVRLRKPRSRAQIT